MPWLALAVRLVVGGVWVRVGLVDLADPLGSVLAVHAYELLPLSVAEQVGYALPAVELVVGLALLAGLLTRGAAAISVALLVALVVGTVSGWVRGFEVLGGASYGVDLVRDVALLLASIVVLRLGPGRLALDPLLLRRRTRVDDGAVTDPEGVR